MENLCEIKTIEELAQLLGMDKDKLVFLANNTEKYYWVNTKIVNGKKRVFHVATGDLKRVQKLIYNKILKRIPLLETMIGCRKGGSTKKNAEMHANNKGFVMNLDIEDFFPSISSKRVRVLFKNLGLSDGVSKFVTKLVTRWGRLPQGICTSGYIAHLIIMPMDKRFKRLCDLQGFKHSFLVDDITINGSGKVKNFINLFCRIIEQEGFKDKKKKRKISGKNERQEVNKLVINSGKPNVFREKRRLVRAKIHNFKKHSPLDLGQENFKKSLNSLLGEIGYIRSVNKVTGDKLLRMLK